MEKGIAFCHGHNHKSLIVLQELEHVQWVLVDIDPNVKPDIVGSFDSMDTIQQLGLYSWNYVMSQNCPIMFTGYFENLLKASKYLLKPHGKLIIPNFKEEVFSNFQELMVRYSYTSFKKNGKFGIFFT